MKGLHTGTEKAAPAWKEWRREFCWEEEPVLAVSGVRLELPEGIPGLRRLERWCRRLEGAWAARWERELYPRACTAARQAREVSHPFRPWEASLTGAVTLHTPECLSLYYDAAERTGGPHGVTLRQGSAWALPGGSPLTLGELFPPGFRWRAWALAEVERQLRARLSAGGVLVRARLGGAAAPQLRSGAFLFDGGGACDLLSTLLHRALCGGDSGLFSRNPGPERKYPGGIAVFLHFLPCQPCRRGVIIKGVPGETPS